MLLHYAPGSPHSAAVRIVLGEKGLEPELHKLDLVAYEQHSSAYLAINPHGTVPLLEDEGRKLFESSFILEYLDDKFPAPPLAGSGPRQRYAARKWGKYVETHIAPHLAIARWAALHGKVPETAVAGLPNLLPPRCELWLRARNGFETEQLAASTEAILTLTAGRRLAADLAGNDWLCGDSFTLGDIAAYPHVAQFPALGLPVPQAVDDWLARVAERPSVRAIAQDLFPVAVMGPEPGRWG
jgi:glutathione S-transferase